MKRVRVLVVDDSAFARKVVREILQRDARIEVVGTARDGLDALEKIATLAPDVVTLDLVMPHLDGLGVLRGVPPEIDTRAVVVSSADEDSDLVVGALLAGAVDSVQKPTTLATDRMYEMSDDVLAAVLRAADARRPAPVAAPTVVAAPTATARLGLVVIGASAGGPNAVARVLGALPAGLPVPVAVVQHMPVGYTTAFAARLDELTPLTVREADDGMPLRAGCVIVARAGIHLAVGGTASSPVARLQLAPAGKPHRPAVDVLFASAAAVLGPRVLGVVLTGMGDDGLLGARDVVAAGGSILAQSAATSVVYGMPRSVTEAGLTAEVVDLDRMADAIVARL